MIGGRLMRQLLVATFLVSLQATQAGAIMMAPEPFDALVPERWRAPFARFLSDLHVSDPASTVEASKVAPFHDQVNGPEMMIFRVVHRETCRDDQDECLTIIAHIEKDDLVPDAMFSAGGKINYGDVIREVLGRSSVPIHFWSRRTIVSVRITARGLVVSSEPAIELAK